MKPSELLTAFRTEFAEQLMQTDYLLADTRIPWASLYDHLILTAGFAVAFVEELLRSGKTAEEVCGIDLTCSQLRDLVSLCGLLHDLGKAEKVYASGYCSHVQRSVEFSQNWLASKGVERKIQEVILSAVARHHLRDEPQTLLEKLICLADSYASAGDRPELAKAENLVEFLRLAEGTLNLERELFGNKKPVSLLLGDVDSIKGYVYETDALPEIRGASEILQELEDEVRRLFRDTLAEEALIYCGGGGFLAIVPAGQAEELKREIERLYLNKTKIATITVVSSDPIAYADIGRGLMPYDDERVKALSGSGVAGDLLFSHFEAFLKERTRRKNFGELISALAGRLQQAKRAKSTAPFFETLPIHRRCESCGKRAAETRDEVRDEWICGICHQKREKGRGERRRFLDKFEEWAKARGLSVSRNLPMDLDTLAGSEGRIALLYADGNNMGDLLQLMPSPASYRHFSEVLEKATKDALFSAIVSVFGKERLEDSRKPLSFEIIALGGDDIVVIVPARYGWTLALHVLEEFERHEGVRKLQVELRERLGDSLRRHVALNLSAGLAIADVKYPVGFLFALAEGLLKEAKRLARETHSSTLCHLWLRAPVISKKAEPLLSSLYKRKELTLTARPYTAEQAKKLTELARALSVLPAAQRRPLAEAVEKGVHVSLNYALYQAARQRGLRTQLQEVFDGLGELLEPARDGFWFWRQTDEGWRTALLDALELIELDVLLESQQEERHAPSSAR